MSGRDLKNLVRKHGVNNDTDVVDTGRQELKALHSLVKLLNVKINMILIGIQDDGTVWATDKGAAIPNEETDRAIELVNYHNSHFEAVAKCDSITYDGKEVKAVDVRHRGSIWLRKPNMTKK